LSCIKFTHTYDTIISLENLFSAWKEFVKNKRSRKDVQEFERNLMDNILALHRDLKNKTYTHSLYEAFSISDPKPRSIHKAMVRDRLLHHALYRKLYPFFDKTFISDSYSCRFNKGTQKAISTFHRYTNKISQNEVRGVWVLKCDVKKFFASIDQNILMGVVENYIPDKDIVWLISQIVYSFYIKEGTGLPLGNLTSQLLVNVYMNKFDQFMKHKIKAKYYIRYADDFAILSHDKEWLENILPRIQDFLLTKLKLQLHPDKISISKVALGVDFLGWVHFSKHRVLRGVTKRRMFRNIKLNEGKMEVVQSYLGLLSHGNGKKLENEVVKMIEKYSG